MTAIKDTVNKSETFDLLEFRLGRIVSVEDALGTPKKAYKFEIDFGKFGKRISIGRFTQHSKEELINKYVIAVLNFGKIQIGESESEVLVLGVQFPKADSGEATIVTPLVDAKIGSKLF